MNVALWIAAGLLAAIMLAAGLMKLSRPKVKLRERLTWVDDFPEPAIKAIAAAEVLGAVGLILPPLVGVAPILTPIAATGLAIIMAGAIVTHVRRKETQPLGINVILLLLAGFVACGRFGSYAF